jgi:hypothetical protein
MTARLLRLALHSLAVPTENSIRRAFTAARSCRRRRFLRLPLERPNLLVGSAATSHFRTPETKRFCHGECGAVTTSVMFMRCRVFRLVRGSATKVQRLRSLQ